MYKLQKNTHLKVNFSLNLWELGGNLGSVVPFFPSIYSIKLYEFILSLNAVHGICLNQILMARFMHANGICMYIFWTLKMGSVKDATLLHHAFIILLFLWLLNSFNCCHTVAYFLSFVYLYFVSFLIFICVWSYYILDQSSISSLKE